MTHLVETDETGRLVLPPELLKTIKPQTRYKLEIVEAAEIMDKQRLDQAASDEWMRQWSELSKEISKIWPEGVSAVDVVSEMRR